MDPDDTIVSYSSIENMVQTTTNMRINSTVYFIVFACKTYTKILKIM